MQSNESQVDGSEILLRRIPPTSPQFQTIVERGDGELRATSAVMATRQGEDHLSCSRLLLTTPRRLLDDLRNDGIDPQGWNVCCFTASDVRAVGLEIRCTPTDRDHGHCSITGAGGLAYPNNKAQKLARRTRVLVDEQIDNPPEAWLIE